MKVKLWLRVERNNKHVRGKKKAREEIEAFVLKHYNMQKPDNDGWEYILSIPYQTDEELDDAVDEMLKEAHDTADLRHCFIEADVRAMDGSERSW